MYMAVMVEQFPQRSSELIEYFRTIRCAANSAPGLAWVVYDNQFHTQAANDHDIYWDSTDMQLWVKLLCVSPSCLRKEYDIFEHETRNGGARGDATCHQYNKAVLPVNGQTVGFHTGTTSQVVGRAPWIFMPQRS